MKLKKLFEEKNSSQTEKWIDSQIKGWGRFHKHVLLSQSHFVLYVVLLRSFLRGKPMA